jgi:PhzF family phenazine biosynthesis protein
MVEGNPTFMIINAFTKDVAGGNPAVVVLLQEDLPSILRQEIATNFNQPISAFIVSFKPQVSKQENTFKIFFHTPKTERENCGHGTLAAAHAVFSTPGMVSEDIAIVTFLTRSGHTLTARKLEMGRAEIVFPSTTVNEVSKNESRRIRDILKKAFSRELVPLFIGKGGKDFEGYLLVELDAQENLRDAMVDAQAFVSAN